MDLTRAKEYLVRRISLHESYEDLMRFPRYLEIETVNVCNARCPMCTIGDWERGAKPMTEDLYKQIASEVIEHAAEVKRVSLYRDGEPLIDKRLPERVAMLKRGGIREVCISTNVSLLTEERSVALLDAELDVIIMSIDSLDKRTFEEIRLRLIFEEVMENAIRFIELRDKVSAPTKIWMRMIRQNSNQHEWPTYQEFWSKRLAEQDRIYYHNIFNWGGQLKDFSPVVMSYEPNLPCVALWSLLVIFCNGDVPLCNVDYNNKYPTGNIRQCSISDLWRSKVMHQRRNLHLKGKKACISLCDACNVWDEPPDGEKISAQYAEPVEIHQS